MNALIVDDEPLARAYLRRLLESQNVIVVGEAENAPVALERAEDLKPDIVFLDIEMPEISGLEMAGALLQLDKPPAIVFVTGYSHYAINAFEHDAVDYLLKPVSPERLAKTLARARARRSAPVDEAANGSEANAANRALSASTVSLRRLPVRGEYAVLLLRLNDIQYAESREKRVFVHVRDGMEHRTYYTLTQLETLLPGNAFIRIHDSYIVRIDEIDELIFLGNHCYEVRLSGDKRLPVGRTRYAELRRALGLD